VITKTPSCGKLLATCLRPYPTLGEHSATTTACGALAPIK